MDVTVWLDLTAHWEDPTADWKYPAADDASSVPPPLASPASPHTE